jgi:hypothetical protein
MRTHPVILLYPGGPLLESYKNKTNWEIVVAHFKSQSIAEGDVAADVEAKAARLNKGQVLQVVSSS